jgi:hypothetical protein
LREHEIFKHPHRIDVQATKAVPVPAAWKKRGVSTAEVQVLPLRDKPRRGMAGWCTSGVDLEDSPEVEVMCGGINTKTPQHAGLWRQGNLMHFGFQETPSEFNATGRALLENAIVYIARFTEDRPIAVTPAGFRNRKYPRSRHWLRQALAQPTSTAKALARRFGKDLRSKVQGMADDEAKRWIRKNMGFLAADADGLLAVDADARALGIALDKPTFFLGALAAAKSEESARRALALLARRIPEGPGASAGAKSWQAFLDAQRDYLFFTEPGGYVWHLDPLAQKRRIPSVELRGSRRARR